MVKIGKAKPELNIMEWDDPPGITLLPLYHSSEKSQDTALDSQSTVLILERNALLYHLEEILSFNLIYRMLGIDSRITEKGGSENSCRNSRPSEWPTVGMAEFRTGGCRNSGLSEWRGVAYTAISPGEINTLRSRIGLRAYILPVIEEAN